MLGSSVRDALDVQEVGGERDGARVAVGDDDRGRTGRSRGSWSSESPGNRPWVAIASIAGGAGVAGRPRPR